MQGNIFKPTHPSFVLKLYIIYLYPEFLKCLDTPEDHIFEYLRFSVPLKNYSVTMQTSIFQIGIPLPFSLLIIQPVFNF